MLTRKVYPYTAAHFVQLLAVNYLNFKVTSLTAITDLQTFVIIVILLSTTKTHQKHIRKQHVLPVLDNSRVGNPIEHQQGHHQQQHQQQQRGTLTEGVFSLMVL